MRIGLTGGVGCGATEVARRLQAKGIRIVSGDEAGHAVLTLPQVKSALQERFGTGIFDQQGEVDRKRLGEIIFADEQARRELNRIVHPMLLDILTAEVRQAEAESGIAVVDAALIYEWGLAGFFHKVIVVSAPWETRISRATTRSGLTREQVLQRIAAQWPLEKKVERADFIIDNIGTLEELYQKVDSLWSEILRA